MPLTTSPRAAELYDQMGGALYREAYKNNMSLSAWLDQEMPQTEYKDGLDGFQRMLMLAGIKTNYVPDRGIWPDEFEKFFDDEKKRALLPEWVARVWRKAATGKRHIYSSNDEAVGSTTNPWIDAAQGRWTAQSQAAIPVSELIAVNTPVTNDAYRAYYLTPAASQQRLSQVAEGAEIPVFKLSGGDHTIRLRKFGGGIESSYEQLRRQRINRVEMHINRMAVQAETDKLAAIITVLVSGDGNSGTAATNYNLTTLDSGASAGTLTLTGWLAFKLKFASPYICTHVLVQEAVALQMLLLDTGSGNMPMVMVPGQAGYAGFVPINPGLGGTVRLGWTSDAPTLKIVGFDARWAIERVYEIGANITEVERLASNQTQSIYMTEVEGHAKFDPGAALTLDVNA